MTGMLTNPTCATYVQHDHDLEAHLNSYAESLTQADLESPSVKEFRETWPQRYVELCKFHLSVLIDLPSNFFEESPTCAQLNRTPPRPKEDVGGVVVSCLSPDPVPARKRATRPWQRFRHLPLNDQESTHSVNGHRQAKKHQQPVSGSNSMGADQFVRNVMMVMDALDTPEHLSIEGVFRKTGNVVRQRLLRQRIATDKITDLDSLINYSEPKPWRPAGRNPVPTTNVTRRGRKPNLESDPLSVQVNVHDLASALKGVLYEMPEPILSSRLLPLFAQVAALTAGRIDDRGTRVQLRPIEERIAEAKQLKALRLLCLLLPETHARLFQRLLRLLKNTLAYSDLNRMTAESLGTLFGPLLLSPGKVHTRDLHNQYNNLARLATTMIDQGVSGLWMIPRSFAQDIERNLAHFQKVLKNCDDPVTKQEIASAHAPNNLVRTASDDSGLGWTEASQPSSDADSCVMPYKHVSLERRELPALVTCINFAVRSKLESTTAIQLLDGSCDSPSRIMSSLGETEFAVAELCAAVQAMPDTDPRKRRLIQRFNATNGGLTPGSNDHARRPLLSRAQWPKTKQACTPSNSPGSVPFTRAHSGNSAFKAAKTIRSSLRRRLALKSTISIGSCFEHHLFDKPIPERSEETFLAKRTPLANVDTFHNTASPVFDCPVPLPNLTSMRLSPTTNPEQQISSARFSLMSTTSIGSLGNGGSGDMFFCCPLVEALASPFRRRAYASNQQTPDSVRSNSINTNCSTPVGRVLRTTGRKRLRCLSPPPVQAYGLQDYNREVSSCSQSRNGELQTYYPIPPSGMLCGPKTPKRSSTLRHERTSHSQSFANLLTRHGRLCRVTTQTNLLAYGYRTVSHTPRLRSASAHTISIRRSETMPSEKSKLPDNDPAGLRPCESLTILSP